MLWIVQNVQIYNLHPCSVHYGHFVSITSRYVFNDFKYEYLIIIKVVLVHVTMATLLALYPEESLIKHLALFLQLELFDTNCTTLCHKSLYACLIFKWKHRCIIETLYKFFKTILKWSMLNLYAKYHGVIFIIKDSERR